MKTFDVSYLDDIDFTTVTTNKKKTYLNIPCSFDIETSSSYLSDGEKTAFMYVWTFAIEDSDHVFYGRTWGEFVNMCGLLQDKYELTDSRNLVVYVHNLAYEFQFMRKHFDWVDVFSTGERKPIKALCSLGIEFRDSYILSGFSLDRLAKNLTNHKIEKLKGDLDYSLIRHSETPLTLDEKAYCINDVLIIIYYIHEQLDIYGDLAKIPMTNTGRVRQYVKDACYYTNKNHRKSSRGKFQRYRRVMEDLQLEEKHYIMLKRAFMGGFTHANASKSGKILDNVTSIDFASSYPSVMLSEKFPMSKPIETELTEEKDFNFYRERFCLLFDVRFTNITNTFIHDNYISESKCVKLKKPIINNGRVFSAEECIMTITDVDLDIIEQTYDFETMEVQNIYRFHKGYLPKAIIESVLKLYEDKTVLKDVSGSEVEYVVSKGMLNSVYGMCVTDIIRDDIIYSDDWSINDADIKEQIKKYNESYSRFLYYPWGVWITAYSRRNLWSGILHVGKDYVYSDTDSIKFENYDKHKPYIDAYNDLVMNKLCAMCDFYRLDKKKLSPKTKDGISKPIGVWELDGKYKRFKTLGAKRYLVEFEDDKLQLTLSGLSKSNGINYMKRLCKNNDGVFDMFNDELYIPADETGKMTHTYIDTEQSFMILDYLGNEYHVTTLSSVHLEKCDFTLSVSKQYIDFIKNLSDGYLYKGLKIE